MPFRQVIHRPPNLCRHQPLLVTAASYLVIVILVTSLIMKFTRHDRLEKADADLAKNHQPS